MKFKKTKLTALAMSVLMAMSTITSVTWAADLFTDGAPTEVAVEAPAEFVSDEEETTEAMETESTENEALLGHNVGGVVWYDAWEDQGLANSPTFVGHALGAYQVDGDGYKVHVQVNGAWQDVNATFVASEPATCEHPARKKVSFTLNQRGDFVAYSYADSDITSYNATLAINPNAYHLQAQVTKYIIIPDDPQYSGADCETSGSQLAYTECSVCHRVKNLVTNNFDNLNTGGLTIEEYLKSNYQLQLNTYLEVKDDIATGHLPGRVDKSTIPPRTVNGTVYGEYDYNGVAGTVAETSYFNGKANCEEIGTTDTFSGAMDATRDAFYYEITYCSKCKEAIKVSKNVFYHANMTEGTEFYLAVKNVYGFISKTTGLPVQGSIVKDDFGGVVLEKCEDDGIYNLCKASKNVFGNNVQGNSYSVVDTLTQPAGHKWYPIGKRYDVNGNLVGGGNYDADGNPVGGSLISPAAGSNVGMFAPANRVYDVNGNLKVDVLRIDSNGEIHSVDCSTKAYYEARQYCMNPNCQYGLNADGTPKGKSNPDLVGTKQALMGNHVYYTESETDYDGHNPGRYIDYTKTTYTQVLDANGVVDPKHHVESYKDHAQCKICHTVEYLPSNTPDKLVDHILVPKEVEGTRRDADCGHTGSYDRQDVCVCGYTDESTRTTVTIPATDAHVFGDNPAQIVWTGGNDGDGAIYIANDFIPGISLHADVVRECTVCHNLDSNGINTMRPGVQLPGADIEITNPIFDRNSMEDPDHWNNVTRVPAGKWCATLRVKDIVPAKKDPATGITYRCSTAHATIYVDWVGTVDGKVTKLSDSKENVPYYASTSEYQARTAHTPGAPQKENEVPATLEAEGHYDSVVYCTVCGDIVSKETVTVPKLEPEVQIPAPTVTAKSANYNTINITWNAIEGASSYRLYYKSAALGVNSWTLVRNVNGTSFNHTALVTGVKYRYTVRAVVDGKLGEFSKKGSVASAKLGAPVLNSVTSVAKGKKLSWSKVDGASGYIIQKDGKRVATVKGGAKVTWTDKKASAGSTYKVRAYRTVYKANYDKTNVYGPFSAAK